MIKRIYSAQNLSSHKQSLPCINLLSKGTDASKVTNVLKIMSFFWWMMAIFRLSHFYWPYSTWNLIFCYLAISDCGNWANMYDRWLYNSPFFSWNRSNYWKTTGKWCCLFCFVLLLYWFKFSKIFYLQHLLYGIEEIETIDIKVLGF